jgi:hypothetical protein
MRSHAVSAVCYARNALGKRVLHNIEELASVPGPTHLAIGVSTSFKNFTRLPLNCTRFAWDSCFGHRCWKVSTLLILRPCSIRSWRGVPT